MGLNACRTQKVSADIEVSNSKRVEYYRPFYESAPYTTHIFALANVNAVYKAASNFDIHELYAVNNTNDSIYILDRNFKNIYLNSNGERTLKGHIKLAKAEDIEKYNTLKRFINNNEYCNLVFSSPKNDNKGIWKVYLVYSTAVNDKIKEQILPLNKLTDIKELTILDLSANPKDSQ
ncbi:hypothetical protein CHU92_15020 [Flavobacterium cyanobacteriorum]|uniref:Uncharacterized protein n=2 Tax=Flavobacterium cyanobacteriorum TaxID=2022802 RepID=A0A255YRW6_9FLAO|nr:hypothetical protein CHU92_15020 [Flavobacterium cyanobacteriorum]